MKFVCFLLFSFFLSFFLSFCLPSSPAVGDIVAYSPSPLLLFSCYHQTPSIIAAIEAKILDPETLCTEIHMCSSSDLLGGSVECSICDAAASYIGQQLQNPDVQKYVLRRAVLTVSLAV